MAEQGQRNEHHGLAAHEVVLLLGTDAAAGLTEAEADLRRRRYGPNELPRGRKAGPLLRIWRQVNSPLVWVLIGAGVVTLALADHVDSAVIFGVVLLNTVLGYVQESKAEGSLEALRKMSRGTVRVIRDGRASRVPSEDLVPGDLVLIEAGEKVPADLRLVRESGVEADESALTGESVPVVKDEVVLPVETPVADRRNMVYSGTLVTSGSGAGIAVATGAATELGEIHRLVGSATELATPLTRKLTRFSQVLTGAILALALVTFVIGIARSESVTGMFTASVALAVGAIPEGLPAAVTITLAIGVVRMARRRAVIRRLPAVETLGSTTVICSDKTGTLTQNQMTVRSVVTADARYEVSGTGYASGGTIQDATGSVADLGDDQALRWTILTGAACNDAGLHTSDGDVSVTGDPTEAAMLVVARKAGAGPDVVSEVLPRVGVIPFSSKRAYMATTHEVRGGGETPAVSGPPAAGGPEMAGQARFVVLAKGAAERIVSQCDRQMTRSGAARTLDAEAVLGQAHELAAEGMRVLATAMRPADHGRLSADRAGDRAEGARESGAGETGTNLARGDDVTGMIFTGLQAMYDPPRPAAAAAIRAAARAGVAVKMITGDHFATAAAIAEALGLLPDRQPGDVLTGADLDELTDAEFADAVERARVFARVSPEQKLRLVEAFQSRGEIVAMTGDGVNDAPALRRADIGVAMGRGGTEVAKDAADMVLTDDDFATIEAAVEEGRGVFDNLTKFIVWTLPTNMAEGLVILAAIVIGSALPILPTQILWINMTTAVFLGLMLAFEPKERGIMRRPPRDPARPLLTGVLIWRIVMVSAVLVGGAWWLFEWEMSSGSALAVARTAAVNLFVMIELFYLFSCRSLNWSMWRIGPLSNRWVVGGVTLQVLSQLAMTYLPIMTALFQTAPLAPAAWLRILLIAVAFSLVMAVEKRFTRQG